MRPVPATLVCLTGVVLALGCGTDAPKGGGGGTDSGSSGDGDGGAGSGGGDGDGPGPDSDGDGVPDDEDCAPDDPSMSPDAPETCDGVDNNCDGLVDDEDPALDTSTGSPWYADADGDGFGDPDAPTAACEPLPGTVADATDCDDGDAAVNPDAVEVPNDGVDNDCMPSTIDDIGGGSFLSTDAATVIRGRPDPVNRLGWVLRTGDIDGDGSADVIAGEQSGERALAVFSAPSARFLEFDEADVTVTGLDTRSGWILDAEVEDVDADGYDDLLVGASQASANNAEGVAYLLHGPLTGAVDASADWSSRFSPSGSSRYFGADVSYFPDVDGDGVPETLVSDYTDDPDDRALYLFSSTSTGDLDPSDAMARVVDVDVRSYADDATAAPDIDGDGFADLVVNDGSASGRTFVFFGPVTSDRTSDRPDQTLWITRGNFMGVHTADFTGDGTPDVAIGAVSGSSGSTGLDDHVYVFDGADTSTAERRAEDAIAVLNDAAVEGFGFSFDSIDYDGSGVEDLLVGAKDFDAGGPRRGAAYLFLGPLSGAISTTSALVSIEAATGGEWLGTRVQATDDIDGDGQPDFWLGAPTYQFDGQGVGAALLFHSSEL